MLIVYIFLFIIFPFQAFTGGKGSKLEETIKVEKEKQTTEEINKLLEEQRFNFDDKNLELKYEKIKQVLAVIANHKNIDFSKHTVEWENAYLDIKPSTQRNLSSETDLARIGNICINTAKVVALKDIEGNTKCFNITNPQEKGTLEILLKDHTYTELAIMAQEFSAIKKLDIYQKLSTQDYLTNLKHEDFLKDYENKLEYFAKPFALDYVRNFVQTCDAKQLNEFNNKLSPINRLQLARDLNERLQDCPVPLIKHYEQVKKYGADKTLLDQLHLNDRFAVLDQIAKEKDYSEKINFINKFYADSKTATPENLDKLLYIRRKTGHSKLLKAKFEVESDSSHFNKETIKCANLLIDQASNLKWFSNFDNKKKLVNICALVEQTKVSIGDADKCFNADTYNAIYFNANNIIKDKTGYSIKDINSIGNSLDIPRQELIRIYNSDEQTEIHRDVINQFSDISQINEREERYSLKQMARVASKFNQQGKTELAKSCLGIVDFFYGMITELKTRGFNQILGSLGVKGVVGALSFLAPKLAFAANPAGLLVFEVSRFLFAAYNLKETALTLEACGQAFFNDDYFTMGKLFTAAIDDSASAVKFVKHYSKCINVYNKFVDPASSIKLMNQKDGMDKFFSVKENLQKFEKTFNREIRALGKKHGHANLDLAKRLKGISNHREAFYNNKDSADKFLHDLEKTTKLMPELLTNPGKVIKELNLPINQNDLVKIEEGIKLLKDKPGFNNLLGNVVRSNNTKSTFSGAMYELQKNVQKVKAGENLKKINVVYKKQNPDGSWLAREFDAETENSLEEYKNENWAALAEDMINNRKNQMAGAKEIADHMKIPYIVNSAYKFPDHMVDWLKKMSIIYKED